MVFNRRKSAWEAIRKDLKLVARRKKKFKGNGFEVHFISTWALEYRENGRCLQVGTGIGKSVRWWDTWVTVELNKALKSANFEAHRVAIIEHLKAAFNHFDIPFEILE
jgi:hypothetical protein